MKKIQNPNIDSLVRAGIFKKIVDICKRSPICPFCGYANGTVKKVTGGCFKVIHEKNVRYKDAIDKDIDRYMMEDIFKNNPELRQGSQKSAELLNPVRAYELFKMINEEDSVLLWMNPEFCRPDTLIMWNVPVPPVPIRPSVPVEVGGGGTTEDDLTVKLQEIIVVNNALKMALDKGATMKMVAEVTFLHLSYLNIRASYN